MATQVVGTDSKEWVTTGSTRNMSPNPFESDAQTRHLTKELIFGTKKYHATVK